MQTFENRVVYISERLGLDCSSLPHAIQDTLLLYYSNIKLILIITIDRL